MKPGTLTAPETVVLGFENDCVTVPVQSILPVRALGSSVKASRKYRQISASVCEVGLVEPPVVARASGQDGVYLLLDGHIRIEIMKDLGIDRVSAPRRTTSAVANPRTDSAAAASPATQRPARKVAKVTA